MSTTPPASAPAASDAQEMVPVSVSMQVWDVNAGDWRVGFPDIIVEVATSALPQSGLVGGSPLRYLAPS